MESDRRQLVRGHAALVTVQLAFGFLPILGTVAFSERGLSPLGLGTWRIGAGAVGLAIAALVLAPKQFLPRLADLPRFAACAVLGVVLNQGLYLTGLARSTPMNAGLVMTLIPVLTFVIAALSRQELFIPIRGLGVLIAMLGALPLIFSGGLGDLGANGLGNIMMAVNALSFSTYLVVAKPLTARYPAIVVTAWAYIIGALALPWFAWGEKLTPDPGFSLGWWSLAYVVVFPTILGYVLNNFALARVRASTTAVYIYLQPLVTVTAAWLVFGERLSMLMVGSASAMFLGIWLVSRKPGDPHHTAPLVEVSAPGT